MSNSTKVQSRPQRFWRENRGTFAFLFLMLMFRSAWADWMTVPTGSMNPTILEGDRILVDKHVFGLRLPWTLIRLTEGRDPQRGEIVVFDSPVDGISLVKRVAGVPGDVVAIDERGLTINGEYANYSPGDQALVGNLLSNTQQREPTVFRELGRVASGAKRQHHQVDQVLRNSMLRHRVETRGMLKREVIILVQHRRERWILLERPRDATFRIGTPGEQRPALDEQRLETPFGQLRDVGAFMGRVGKAGAHRVKIDRPSADRDAHRR